MRPCRLHCMEVPINVYKKNYEDLLAQYPSLVNVPVWEAYEIMHTAAVCDKKILLCGNGGSASDSEHIVGELMKGFKLLRKLDRDEIEKFGEYADMAEKLQKGIQAVSLNSHTALMTAIGNDNGYDVVFAQQVYVYGQPGDVLIAMTTSGNSANVVNAAATAKVRGMKVIGITGAAESRLSKLCDVCLRLPERETYRIQELTLPVYHALCAMLEEALYG